MKTLSTLLGLVLIVTIGKAQDYDPVGWYNYGDVLFNDWNFSPANYRTFIFPDSTAIVEYSGGTGYAWMHGLGQVFDPTSEWWENGNINMLGEDVPYMVDSVGFWYWYNRPQTENPDTLIVQFFKEENFEAFYIDPWEGDPEYEGRSYGRLAYDSTIRRGANPHTEIEFLLDDDDAHGEYRWMSVPIEEEIMPGEVCGMSVTYLPGNEFNVNDSIDFFMTPPPVIERNAFVMIYWWDNNDFVFETGIYNHGIIARASARYYDNSNGWGAQYWPGIAGGNGLFHMDGGYHISQGVNVAEYELPGIEITHYPNPFRESVTFNIDSETQFLGQLQIQNLVGDIVHVQNLNVMQGQSQVQVDTRSLAPGLYVYSLTNGDVLSAGKICKK